MMNHRVSKLVREIAPLKQQIIDHKVYASIKSLEDLRIFMQYHVFAVWDFMSLLKVLQSNLTCTRIPWFPVGSGNTRYFINEIVLGEESDVDLYGVRKSHFEIYMDAMNQSGADCTQIDNFLNELKLNYNLEAALSKTEIPSEVREFVNFTFEIIQSNKPHLQSAIFTFGREDLIPGMFISLVNDLQYNFPETLDIFKYYLERHIEIDGDHHSKLAIEMTSALCGDSDAYWQEAENATINALQMRINLWDGAYRQIVSQTR